MRSFIKSVIFTIFLFLTVNVNAQPGGGGPDGGGDPDNNVPITGIEVLLIAGGALGISRFVKSKLKR
ncbi:MAG: hypothetical protein AAFX87_19395 [Bacteroidota bacterium]